VALPGFSTLVVCGRVRSTKMIHSSLYALKVYPECLVASVNLVVSVLLPQHGNRRGI
jgi:hypothetical protein